MKPREVPADLMNLACARFTDEPVEPGGEWMPLRQALAAVLPAYEQQVRERVAAEYRDAARAIEDTEGKCDDPLAKAIGKTCLPGPERGTTYDDPHSIAFVAYRNLAKRLARGES